MNTHFSANYIYKWFLFLSRTPGYPEASNGGTECVGDPFETMVCDAPACDVCVTNDGVYNITQLINETSCEIW